MIQIPREVYFKESYNCTTRFISYKNQIDLVKSFNPKSVLEIGIGNGLVTNYLRSCNISVVTFDFDKSLCPDFIGDVRNINLKERFDVILCCQTLEHIPYEDLDNVLKRLSKISNNLIISVPQITLKIIFGFKLPMFKRYDFLISIPYGEKHKFSGEHYWELSKRGYNLKNFRNLLNKYFDIQKEFRNPLNPNHRFFILKTNNKQSTP